MRRKHFAPETLPDVHPFSKEEEEGDINYEYELKKANFVINNLIEQRNMVLNELAMVRAECMMLNEELAEYKEENEKETEEEETNEE